MFDLIIDATLSKTNKEQSTIIVRSKDFIFNTINVSYQEKSYNNFYDILKGTIDNISESNKLEKNKIPVLIDNHGMSSAVYESLKELGYNVIDKSVAKKEKDYYNYYEPMVPYNVINFDQLDQREKLQDLNEDMSELFIQMVEMGERIITGDWWSEDESLRNKTKSQLMEELIGQFMKRFKQLTNEYDLNSSIFKSIKDIKEENIVTKSNDVLLYKDASGNLKWAGIHSNKYEDRDKDILTEQAHKDFINRIYKGEANLPELQIWHSGVPVGQAEWINWHEKGFLVSGGIVFKDFEDIVIDLCKKGKCDSMSHGFYESSVKYDEDGNIIAYTSTEVSMLPNSSAANLLTYFIYDEN